MVLHGQFHFVIGVVESADRPRSIGMASCMGWNRYGLGVWRLTVRGAQVPDRGVIIDGRYRVI